MFQNFFQEDTNKNPTLSISRQTTCPKKRRDMYIHLWEQKHQMTTNKETTQQL